MEHKYFVILHPPTSDLIIPIVQRILPWFHESARKQIYQSLCTPVTPSLLIRAAIAAGEERIRRADRRVEIKIEISEGEL